VRIADGEIIDGRLPPTVARVLKEWTDLRRDALMRNWQAARTGWAARTYPWVGMMIDVIGVHALGGHKLEIEFSDGTIGVRDFSDVLQKTGAMSEPLKEAAYFQRVFIEDGALTWPNGYDWDPIALHDEMKEAKLLRRMDAAE
jgi:hypothetical protein